MFVTWSLSSSSHTIFHLMAGCSSFQITFRSIDWVRGPHHCHLHESDTQAAPVSRRLSVSCVERTRHNVFSRDSLPSSCGEALGLQGTVPVTKGAVWIGQHEAQWWSVGTMQTAGRKKSSGCNLFSAASPLAMSTDKAWAVFTAGKNSEHWEHFIFAAQFQWQLV